MEQIIIAITGVTAIWLTQDERKQRRRFACLFGLAGQPFWIHSAWVAGQWGILVLALFYTVAWAKGFRTYWINSNTSPPLCTTSFDLAAGPDCAVVRCNKCKQFVQIERGGAQPGIGWCGCDSMNYQLEHEDQ